MEATFRNPETRLKSALFAGALVLAVFSALPSSRSLSGESVPQMPIKVDSARVNLKKYEAKSETLAESNIVARKSVGATPHVSIEMPNLATQYAPLSELSISSYSDILGNAFGKCGAEAADFVQSVAGEGENADLDIGIFDASKLDTLPRRISGAPAMYPSRLLNRGIEGDVKLLVLINENGEVVVESVVSASDELFAESAIKAAGKFRYETPMRNGKPVKARFILPVPFRIERR